MPIHIYVVLFFLFGCLFCVLDVVDPRIYKHVIDFLQHVIPHKRSCHLTSPYEIWRLAPWLHMLKLQSEKVMSPSC